MDNGNVHKNASIAKIDVNVRAFPVLAKIARLRARGNTRVIECRNQGVADEIMTECGSARLQNGTAEEVGGAGERFLAEAVAGEGT